VSFYFEDLSIGASQKLGDHVFTREAIIAFAILHDPQPFHLSEEAAKSSIYGGLIASGWHTAGIGMRLIVEFRQRQRADFAARGETYPKLGVSPGVREIRWPAPVRPGDRVAYSSEIISLTPTRRAEWGLASSRTIAVNQDGVQVYSVIGGVLWERRPA
jgi:acyl dehydratase